MKGCIDISSVLHKIQLHFWNRPQCVLIFCLLRDSWKLTISLTKIKWQMDKFKWKHWSFMTEPLLHMSTLCVFKSILKCLLIKPPYSFRSVKSKVLHMADGEKKAPYLLEIQIRLFWFRYEAVLHRIIQSFLSFFERGALVWKKVTTFLSKA